MNNLEKITNAKSYISTATVPQALLGINNIINSYKEYKIAEAMESTKRAAIREEARIQICALQEATKREKYTIDGKVTVSLAIIEAINQLLLMKDVLDEGTIKVCMNYISFIKEW